MNEDLIISAGGVEALMKLLKCSDEALLDAALCALSNLIANQEARMRMVEVSRRAHP